MSQEPVIVRVPSRVPPLEDDPDDFMGYEVLVEFLEQRPLHGLGGDIIEIGAFMGRGTAKLARLAQRCGKMVYVIDIFEPSLDQTLSKGGIEASDVYEGFLRGRSMYETYRESTRGLDNILTIREDSRRVRFGPEQTFAFGFIDGCHQQAYVENDFCVIWPHLVPGGMLGIHDYKFDEWPEVTTAVVKLMREHSNEIAEAYEIEGKYSILSLLLVKK
jgi:hypothetical protein